MTKNIWLKKSWSKNILVQKTFGPINFGKKKVNSKKVWLKKVGPNSLLKNDIGPEQNLVKVQETS